MLEVEVSLQGMNLAKPMERIHFVGKLAAALAPGKLPDLGSQIAAMVPEPIATNVAYEIVLQSYLFFGYAQAIEAAKLFAEVCSQKNLTHAAPDRDRGDRNSLTSRGVTLCRKIYSPNYERLIGNMARVSPELAAWMVEEGYGKVLSRPGPSELEREIASIVFLAISRHPVQLYSHIRGAKNLGADRTLLVSIAGQSGLSEQQETLILETIEKVFDS